MHFRIVLMSLHLTRWSMCVIVSLYNIWSLKLENHRKCHIEQYVWSWSNFHFTIANSACFLLSKAGIWVSRECCKLLISWTSMLTQTMPTRNWGSLSLIHLDFLQCAHIQTLVSPYNEADDLANAAVVTWMNFWENDKSKAGNEGRSLIRHHKMCWFKVSIRLDTCV